MAFKVYDTIADYQADPLPLEESRVALIMKDNSGNTIDEIKYDSVGRTTEQPLVGDVCCLDENNKIKFLVGGNSLNGSLQSGWTLVGYVFNRNGNKVKILNKTESTEYGLSCWQYAITTIAGASISISVRMYPNYNSYTTVNATLSDNSNDYINSTTATEITAALENAQSINDTDAWWAWYDSVNNRIVVQTDACKSGNQTFVTGSNCTIALCVWDNKPEYPNVPAMSNLLRKTGISTDGGVVNISAAKSSYGTEGTTPTSNVSVNATSLVKKVCFEDSTNAAYGYCAALREEYGTYENYIAANKVKYPQKYGVFLLSTAEEIMQNYGDAVAPTKSGGTMYKFPLLHACAIISYDNPKLNAGKWHLSDITDIIEYMDDNTLRIIAKSQNKMGTVQITNTAYRWIARRARSNSWWHCAPDGTISIWRYVNNVAIVRAVCTLDLTQINQSNNS